MNNATHPRSPSSRVRCFPLQHGYIKIAIIDENEILLQRGLHRFSRSADGLELRKKNHLVVSFFLFLSFHPSLKNLLFTSASLNSARSPDAGLYPRLCSSRLDESVEEVVAVERVALPREDIHRFRFPNVLIASGRFVVVVIVVSGPVLPLPRVLQW